MTGNESYIDIVWEQFKKNRSSYIALWAMLPVIFIAIFAPLIASNVPLVFVDGDEVLFPWFRALFNPGEVVDFVFNMSLLGFLPWLAIAIVTNRRLRRNGVTVPKRLMNAVFQYLVITFLLTAIFGLPDKIGIPSPAPSNRYYSRSFAREEFKSPETKYGYYVPIPFGPIDSDLDSRFAPPLFRKDVSKQADANDLGTHWLGTDNIGRDVLTRMIYGTRISMTIGLLAVSIYLTIGVIVGALAGYYGGAIDLITSRIIEVVLLFPAFFLILIMVAFLGQSIYIIMVVIGLTGWPTIARLIRGEVLKQRSIDYATAAKALGSSHLRIIFRHILPNAISPALVAAPFGIAGAIITEAGLSLLGFGVRPPAPTWGALLHLGHDNYKYWWLIVVPSIAIFVTVTVFNLIGSGLRDAMDPKLRR
jgi:peptide/nickel transport system permease protein